MFRLSDEELYRYIQEDVPYHDLTTYIQDATGKRAKLDIYTRDEIVVACSKEATRIAQLLECEVLSAFASKSRAEEGDTILSFEGDYNSVHKAWRVTQILLEYSCKIATYTNEMLANIRQVNPKCELLTTRKTFPFSKKLCINSVLAGGGLPHRLNLSETILFFDHHRALYGSNEAFYKEIDRFKTKVPEKKIVVESGNFEDASALMRWGADVIQSDKIDVAQLQKIVALRDKEYPHIKILASGGIDKSNAKEYASCGIDGIITSKVYACGMANLGSKMAIE
jgi:molybdenum transport protein